MENLTYKHRILIGTPINSIKLYCWEDFKNATKNLNLPVLIVDTSEHKEMKPFIEEAGFMYDYIYSDMAMDRVVKARQKIVDYAVKEKYDYIMWIDADVIVEKDIVERLLTHNKDIVSAIYMTIGKNELPRIVHNIETDKSYEPMPIEFVGTGLKQASQIGMGCSLMKVDVIKNIPLRCERYENGFIRYGEDYCFSNDAWLKYDIPIWVDTNIQVKHKVNDTWDLDKT